MSDPLPLAHVVGRNVRRLRDGAAATLDDVAKAARENGLRNWGTGRVSDLEHGKVSPTLATLNNVRQILIVCQDYVAGHKADGGALLWEHPWPGCSSTDASVSQPVAFGDDRVLLSKAYGGGSQLLRVCPAADRLRVEVLWAHKNLLRTKFTNVVLRDRHVYGLSDGILECVDRETGKGDVASFAEIAL